MNFPSPEPSTRNPVTELLPPALESRTQRAGFLCCLAVHLHKIRRLLVRVQHFQSDVGFSSCPTVRLP